MALSKIQSESIDLADNFAGMRFGGTASDNALNDYEEGTWTPVFQDAGGDSYTGSYAAQRAKYTKVGNMVTVWAQLNATNSLDTHGLTGGEGVQIHGLPFTSLNEDSNTPSHAGSAGNVNGINFPSGYTQINPVIGRGITYMILKLAGDNVSDASVTCSNFQSGEIFLCVTYRAT